MDRHFTHDFFQNSAVVSNVRMWDEVSRETADKGSVKEEPGSPKRRRLGEPAENALSAGRQTNDPQTNLADQAVVGKEGGELPLVETGHHSWKPTKQLKVPDAIEALARRGKSLRYDAAADTYTVFDGPLFEEEFNALRATRGKKNEAAKDRPFSRMHRHFVLLQGEKWAGTGSIFAPKGAASPSPETSRQPSPAPAIEVPTFNVETASSQMVMADSVVVSIIRRNGQKEVVSMQHLLNMCGATELQMVANSGSPSHPFYSGVRLLGRH